MNRENSLIRSLACLLVAMCCGGALQAATLHVTSNADAGAGALRDQVNAAVSGDTVEIDVSGTISLLSEIAISGKDLVIIGPGATSLTITTTGKSRALSISNGQCTLSGMTFDNCSSAAASVETGGAIAVDNFTSGGTNKVTTIADCAFTNNSAGWGGALDVFQGGLVLERCTFAGNSCTGVAFGTAGGGGAVSLGPTVASFIRNCTFSGNSQNGAATGQPGGGAIYSFGVDAANAPAVTIEHCTFVGNVDAGGAGGAIKGNFTASYHTSTQLCNCLLLNNQAPGTALRNFAAAANGQLSPAFSSQGGNVTDEATSSGQFMAAGLDHVGVASLAASVATALALNGGPTKTHAITRGSPAQHGAVASTVTTDQRGAPRSGGADAGAFQLIEPKLEVSFGGAALSEPGVLDFGSTLFDTPVAKTVTIKNTQTSSFVTGPLVLGPLSLPAGFSSDAPGSITLANGESVNVQITLSPSATGVVNGLSTFLGNDAFNAAIAGNDAALSNVHQIQFNGLITDTLDHWRQQNFGAGAGNAGASADDACPSGDGIKNLMKYALGLDPQVSYPALGSITIDFTPQGALRMTVPRNPAAADLDFEIQVTDNLADPLSWVPLTTTIDQDDPLMLQAHDTVTRASGGHRFIRLQVVRN